MVNDSDDKSRVLRNNIVPVAIKTETITTQPKTKIEFNK